MSEPLHMDATRSGVVLHLDHFWAARARSLGEVEPLPARVSGRSAAGSIVDAEMRRLADDGVLAGAGGDAYLPGPRWGEAVTAALAYKPQLEARQ